jgi:hypothetical protein
MATYNGHVRVACVMRDEVNGEVDLRAGCIFARVGGIIGVLLSDSDQCALLVRYYGYVPVLHGRGTADKRSHCI